MDADRAAAKRCEHGYGAEGCTYPSCWNAAKETPAAPVPEPVPWEAFVTLMADYLESEGQSRDSAEAAALDWITYWKERRV